MALVFPTTPTKGAQGLITKWSGPEETGYGLFIDEQGELAVRIGRGKGVVEQISSGKPLFRKVWYLVAASFDAASGHISPGAGADCNQHQYGARDAFSPSHRRNPGRSRAGRLSPGPHLE